MKNNFEQDFSSLLRDLEGLRKIRPEKQLRYRINNMLLPSLPVKRGLFVNPFIALRPLALAILFLIFTGSSVVLAAQNSKPGDMLYPVKTFVAEIMDKNDSKPQNSVEEKVIVPATPTPTPEELEEIILEIELPEGDVPSPAPNPNISLKPDAGKIVPTDIPVNLPLSPALEVNIPVPTEVEVVLPVGLNLNIGNVHIGL